ncbi:NlpC/P60 family protein [Streptomyces sp. NPDC057445]|uniref:C40 family peptidase n=1 Tax=Streptomyces sp. NPDC057445 TaxID=3346136 RepID=UPI0036B71683
MSGRLLRTICTAALAATTALVVTTPAAAEPDAPGAAGRAVTGEPGAVLLGGREPKNVARLLTTLRELYRQAEEATEAYNATEQRLTTQRAETRRLTTELTAARDALERSRGDAGRLARRQYQGSSDLSAYLRLLLARNPQQALDEDHLMERAAYDQAATIARLERSELRADKLAARSHRALDLQKALTEKQREQRDTVQARLRKTETLLASLSGDELTELASLERADTAGAQRELLESGLLGGGRLPSKAGSAALEYAVEQIGKPYVWGAEGPDSFDCSGLTSRAWADAGRVIPRTSQEQWARLPRVPLRSLRPGDLVIYFPKATHVAIYLGNGLVIQAPRPGTRVKVSPIASNPLLGAVRPDPTAAPLAAYTPPKLPEGAGAGSDTGYGTAAAPGR